MPKAKIDRVKLNQMLRSGKSQNEIAKFFGVTPGAISKTKKELNISVVKNVALEHAHKVVEKNLDAIDQLRRINETANELLDRAVAAQDHATAIKCMSEIRQQLGLQLEILSTLNDIKAVQEFQASVLEAIGEASLEVRNAVIDKLHARNALRRAIEISR
jgi:predicted transcriptional regulator